MKREASARRLARLGAAAGLLVALGVGAGDGAHAPADPPPPDARSRFTRQTSEVWRYRQPFARRDLPPVPNNTPYPEPIPHRERPRQIAVVGHKAYVALAGTEGAPGRHLAVLDLDTGAVLRRIEVGQRPYQPVLHPDGRFLVVTNELSNYASVVDTTRDVVVGEIPLDYYAQGLVFAADGRRAWVANRYLDQVLVLDVEVEGGADGPTGLRGRVRQIGGFDDAAFFEHLDGMLRARCGACHAESAGGYVAGPDRVENFLSAVENAVGGQPEHSPLWRAVVPRALGGFGDEARTPEHHPGGALFEADEPETAALEAWIRAGDRGPGIPVGNPGSHPKDLALSPDGRHLFVGNTGTMDVSVIDVEAEREVGAFYLQSPTNHLLVVDGHLVVLTLGAGFGATKARDPHGAETWDRDHEAAQLAVLRDPRTTDPLPASEQPVLGPFDAVDDTWNFKMRDIQNDVVLIDLAQVDLPSWRPGLTLDYLLRADRYEAHPAWVRYTSDTAEATTGDVKGDIPPELQRVPGAFPEWATVVGDRLYMSMAGSFEVVEWALRLDHPDPALRLEPLRSFPTGLRPVGLAAAGDRLVVANGLSESVSLIDRRGGDRIDVIVGDATRPPLDTDAEKGELIAHTTVFSSDGDTSCSHCHYRDTGDGRAWGAGEVIGQDHFGHQTPGGTLGIPQMRNVYALQPFYFEGTHRLSEGQGADVTEPMSSIDFDRPIWAGDFTAVRSTVPEADRRPRHEELKERVELRKLGSIGYDLEARREAFVRQQSRRYFGHEASLTDLFRYLAVWMGNGPRLLPNPYDQQAPAVRRGRALFNDARVMCSVCHAPPEFTNKRADLAPDPTRSLPQLTTVTRRDASYTLAGARAVEIANGDRPDLAPSDAGRVEAGEGRFTTMALRGIFDRPPVFLHNGRARSLREVLATPGHPGLRGYRLPVLMGPEEVRPGRREIGLNETTGRTPAGPLDLHDQIADTHGGTAHLTPRQLDDLLAFLRSIE